MSVAGIGGLQPEALTMFHELLDNPNRIEPGPLQAAARKQFPDVVRRSLSSAMLIGLSPNHFRSAPRNRSNHPTVRSTTSRRCSGREIMWPSPG